MTFVLASDRLKQRGTLHCGIFTHTVDQSGQIGPDCGSDPDIDSWRSDLKAEYLATGLPSNRPNPNPSLVEDAEPECPRWGLQVGSVDRQVRLLIISFGWIKWLDRLIMGLRQPQVTDYFVYVEFFDCCQVVMRISNNMTENAPQVNCLSLTNVHMTFLDDKT